MPAQLAYHFWPAWSVIGGFRVDYLSPALYLTDIIILALIAPWLIRPVTARETRRISPEVLFIILLTLTNIGFSFHPLTSLFKFLRLYMYGGLFLFLVHYKSLFLKSLSRIFPLTVLWVCLLALFQFIFQSDLGGPVRWLGERPLSVSAQNVAKIGLGSYGLTLRAYATFPHPNALAGFLIVSFLMLSIVNKKSAIYLALLTVLALTVTFSRTALMFCILVLGYILSEKIKVKKTAKTLLILGILLPVLIYGVAKSGSIKQSASYLDRVGLMSDTLETIASHPVFGVGFGVAPMFSPIRFQPVHNAPLLLISELGIPFAIFIFYYIFARVGSVHKNRIVNISFMAVLFTGLADHYWLTSTQNLLLLVFCFALLYINFEKY